MACLRSPFSASHSRLGLIVVGGSVSEMDALHSGTVGSSAATATPRAEPPYAGSGWLPRSSFTMRM